MNPLTAPNTDTRTSSRLRRWVAAIIVLFGMVAVTAPPAAGGAFNEYQVKAVFLYNLAHFVDWPETAFDTADQNFIIGILGPDPFGSELAHVVADETLHGRAIVIVRYDDMADFDRKPCHMLFVNVREKTLVKTLCEKLTGSSVLTVSDHAGFAHEDGMINLHTAGGRIQLEINMDNVRRAGLQISAKLLNLARLIPATR